MGACCTRPIAAEANGAAQTANGAAAQPKAALKKGASPGQVVPVGGPTENPVEKSMVKREKSLHLDAASKRNLVANDLAAAGRSFARNNTLETSKLSPEGALQELMKGNARFILGETEHPHQDFKRLADIAPHQAPFAAVLACADSRVPVEIVFDQGFGDVFCCRVAGNIASAEEVASLEYAVLELGVKVIMIMGHTACGAVKAACSGNAFPGFIDILVNDLDVAISRAQTAGAKDFNEMSNRVQDFNKDGGNQAPSAAMVERVIRENALYQLERCRRSTIILEAIKKGTVMLVPAVYHLETGEVEVLA